MALWQAKRINPSVINNGQQYVDGNDYPSILDLNDTIEGQIYSNNLSEQAVGTANSIATKQTEFEKTINEKQSTFENKITTQQTDFETAINTKQTNFENKITEQQNDFEEYITERQDKTEEIADEALTNSQNAVNVSNQAKDFSQRAFEKANTAEFNSIEAKSVAIQANIKASDVERRANDGEFNGLDGANGVIIEKDIFMGFEQGDSYIQGGYTITPINVIGGKNSTFDVAYEQINGYTLNTISITFGG